MTYTPNNWLDDLIADYGIERFKRILKEVETEIAVLGMAEGMPRMHKTTKAKAKCLLAELTPNLEWLRSGIARAEVAA
jgi:hypothetical protein